MASQELRHGSALGQRELFELMKVICVGTLFGCAELRFGAFCFFIVIVTAILIIVLYSFHIDSACEIEIVLFPSGACAWRVM